MSKKVKDNGPISQPQVVTNPTDNDILKIDSDIMNLKKQQSDIKKKINDFTVVKKILENDHLSDDVKRSILESHNKKYGL